MYSCFLVSSSIWDMLCAYTVIVFFIPELSLKWLELECVHLRAMVYI